MAALLAEFVTRATTLVAEVMNYVAYVPGVGGMTGLDFSQADNSGYLGVI